MAIDFVNPGTTRPFRYWCQKVLPAVYDDSLSYYELLCKVAAHLNDLVELTNTQSDAITELQTLVENFLEMDVDPYIEELVDKWFQDNQPQIVNRITTLENEVNDLTPLKNKSSNNLNIIMIGDSYGRGVGATDNQGWPHYVYNCLHPNYVLNVSNSGAGFVAAGHSSEYGATNFMGQVEYAYNNLSSKIAADDIDLVIIAGGYNDHAQTGQDIAAKNTFAKAHELFPNARLVFYPLCAPDRELNGEFLLSYSRQCFGAAAAGADVHNEALYWLYPYGAYAAYGDKIHPNANGYNYIGHFIAGSVLGGTYLPNTGILAAGNAGFSLAEDVTNVDFRAGALNGMAFYGGSLSRTGKGSLFYLPSYCRSANTRYELIFGYADQQHNGIFRARILSNGLYQIYVPQTGTFDETLEYQYWIPPTVMPLGNVITG